MNSIAKRSHNFAFYIMIFKSLCPLWPKNLLNPYNPWLIIRALRVYSWFNLKNKTKPNKANFLETKPHSKPKNGDFRQIYDNLFMQNKANL